MNRRAFLFLIAAAAAAAGFFAYDGGLRAPGLAFAAKLGEPGPHSPHDELAALPLQLVFDQARGQIISRQENGEIVSWDLATGDDALIGQTDSLFGYCPAEQRLVTSDAGGLVYLDFAQGEIRHLSETHYDHAAWSGDCTRLLLAEDDSHRVELWDGARLRPLSHAETGEPVRNGLALSDDGRLVAAALGTFNVGKGHETSLALFEVSEDDALTPLAVRDDTDMVLGMWTMAFAPDARSLFVGAQIAVYSGLRSIAPTTGETHWGQDGFRSYWVRAIAVSPAGDLLLSGDEKGMLRAWNAETGALLFERETGMVIQSLAFSPDGKSLAIGLKDSTIRIVELASLTG